MASFADAYDLFAVNFANVLFAYVYYPDRQNGLPASVDLGIKMSSLVGTVIGQIGFGVLNDMYGRKKVAEDEAELTIDVWNRVDHYDCGDAGFNSRNEWQSSQRYRHHHILATDPWDRHRRRLPQFFGSCE